MGNVGACPKGWRGASPVSEIITLALASEIPQRFCIELDRGRDEDAIVENIDHANEAFNNAFRLSETVSLRDLQ